MSWLGSQADFVVDLCHNVINVAVEAKICLDVEFDFPLRIVNLIVNTIFIRRMCVCVG